MCEGALEMCRFKGHAVDQKWGHACHRGCAYAPAQVPA